ncbi:SDR family NAD(P)-dependent oxidoreductase [uncultured Roseovarius sp.]|uniref:SDR family NAD(P)-dependent oxidoreductase n=1 Tax=uncultured Roseovarius sp. TaxID=293344 RepID=UPI002602AEBE|nr:SDR family oxidoreductase [uncultured Roseovarius sp.]
MSCNLYSNNPLLAGSDNEGVHLLMKLDGKVVIVTGGGRGIGAAICKAFAAEGAHVVVADINEGNAKEVASEVGNEAMAVALDVRSQQNARTMAERVVEKFGRVDVLMNNAGARVIKGLMQHTQDDWHQMLDINLGGPFICSQAVLPQMLKQESGNIINVASIASFMGRPNRVAYVAAKSGVLGLTRAMAADLAGKNIRVNAIAPGMVASPFNQSFAEADDTGPAWASENLIGRWGQPEDIAGAAIFLASDDSSFINGSEIKVEGGWLAARSRSGEVPIWDE